MTGVYEHALGDVADDLHPKVRERYGIGPGDAACVGTGEMDISRGAHLLPVLYAMTTRDLLFPESGDDVPFTVTTVGYELDEYEALTTKRTFDFDGKERGFDSVTVWDHGRNRLFDFLGKGGLLASELYPRVEDGALVVEGGKQWTRVGGRYIPLPGPFAANVAVRDRYGEEEGCYHVDATVKSPLVGHILSYRGTFTQTMEPMDDVSEDLRPLKRLARLPP